MQIERNKTAPIKGKLWLKAFCPGTPAALPGPRGAEPVVRPVTALCHVVGFLLDLAVLLEVPGEDGSLFSAEPGAPAAAGARTPLLASSPGGSGAARAAGGLG